MKKSRYTETQIIKVAHLRNLYQKVGMFGLPAIPFVQTGDITDRGIRHFGGLTNLLVLDLQGTRVTDAGLNPYLMEMANIREHCSWVHSKDKDAATQKAKDIVRMSVARAAHLEPLQEFQLPVNKAACSSVRSQVVRFNR